MREEQVKRLLSAVDEMPLSPSTEFIGRVRQEIIAELHTTSDSAPESTPRSGNDDENSKVITMVELADGSSESTSRRGRRRGAVLGGLVAAGLALAVATQAMRGTTADVDTSREIDVAGLAGDREASAAFAVVEAAYAGHEAGDAQAWAAARYAGSESPRSDEMAAVAGRLSFGERIEVIGCEYLGEGDWPAFLDSGQLARGHRFRCQTGITDDILRLAGVGVEETTDWVVADDRVIGANGDVDLSDDLIAFDMAFRTWLADNHPVGIVSLDNFTRLPELLDFAEEFLAQSDDFPQTTEGP